MRLIRIWAGLCFAFAILPLQAALPEQPISLDYYYRWQQLMQADHGLDELALVHKVDRFVNQAEYRTDQARFAREDVWSAPDEFFSQAEGDCEDFAIAKYFTLIAMGVPMERLQLVYGKLTDTDTEHMVLRYQPGNGASALLLDNITLTATTEDVRKDFQPIYQFDQQHLWLMNNGEPLLTGQGTLQTPQWQRVLQRWQPRWLALN